MAAQPQVDEDALQELEKVLEVPRDALQAIAGAEEFSGVVEKIIGFINGKQNEIREYESTLAEFSVNLAKRDQDLGKRERASVNVLTCNEPREHKTRNTSAH